MKPSSKATNGRVPVEVKGDDASVEPRALAPSAPPAAAPAELSMRGFVKELRRIDQLPTGQTFVFLIGAGASVTSGIPSAAALADIWLKELHELDPTYNGVPFHQWLHDRRHGIDGLDPKNLAASYSAIFDRRFAANPALGFAHLTKLMQDAQPGFGYSVLATLLSKSKHRAVVTTNFDSLVERALLYYTDHTPLTCTDETGAGTFDKDLPCPLIIKCHRDLHLHPHNGVTETSQLHENFGKALRSLFPGKVLIAVGYGGNDPSLMGFLEMLEKEQRPSAVYWCYWEKGGVPGERIRSWVAACHGRLVPIPGFDELMSGIKGEFGYDLLEQEMESQHKARVKRYKDQVEQIVKKVAVTAAPSTTPHDPARMGTTASGTAETLPSDAPREVESKIADAVDFASESITKNTQADPRKGSAWMALLSILSMNDPKAKENAFEKAVSEFPGDPDVNASYAEFLEEQRRYGEAAAQLERAIQAVESRQPADPSGVAAFRSRRARVRCQLGDFAGAEADIQRSIDGLEPQSQRDDLELAANYAWRAVIRQARGDLVGAEADIQKSIDRSEAEVPRAEPLLAVWYVARASIRRERGLLKEAEEDIAKSIAWGEAQSPRDERGLANWYSTRAVIRRDRGLLKEAEEDIAKSIAWGEAQSPRDERGLAIWYSTRAGIRQGCGLLKEAEEDIAKSIAWREAQSHRDERSLAIDYATRAGIRRDRGLLKEAEEDIAKSIAWGEGQSPRDERSLAIDYATRAGIRQDRGDLAGAEADIRASNAWFEKQVPQSGFDIGLGYAREACIRRDMGRHDEALPLIDWGLNWAKAQQPIDAWRMAVWSGDRATILAELDRLPEACADIAACIDWHRQHQPGNNGRMSRFLRDQARILAQSGDWAGAAKAIAESLSLHVAVFGDGHEWTSKVRAWQRAIDARKVPPRWLDTKP